MVIEINQSVMGLGTGAVAAMVFICAMEIIAKRAMPPIVSGMAVPLGFIIGTFICLWTGVK